MTSDVGNDADFVIKTRAELARLVAEAAAIRARAPQHRICSDLGACRHCKAVRDAHRLIDDHLSQLFDLPDEPMDELRTASAECSLCGRGRYRNTAGAVVCYSCDGHVSGQRWSPA